MRRVALRLFLVVAAGLGSASPAEQADPNAEAWARVAELAAARMREANTPGMALAVTSRQRLPHAAAFVSAERLRFDSIVEGQALRAQLSGVDDSRVFTP